VEINRKIVIITDGVASTQGLAEDIAALIERESGYSTAVVSAESFSGEDLLPAYAFFLGCGEPKPPSFFYIETLFEHINLAGRSCGIFSSNDKAGEYISSLVRSSECTAGEAFLAKGGIADHTLLQNWIQSILQERKKNE
jgi:hypothetical protein